MRNLNKGKQRETKINKDKQRRTKVNKGIQSGGLWKCMKNFRTFELCEKV